MRLKPSLFFLVSLALLFFYGLFSPACVKSYNPPPNNTPSITGLVQSGTNLTLVKSILKRTHLDLTLSGTGPFTFFVPSDAAFAASNIDSVSLGKISDSALTVILSYHIIDSALYSSNLPQGPNGKLITSSGDSLFVTKNNKGIFINGVQLVQGDIQCTNGIVQVVNRVLLPPNGNFMKIIQGDTSFSFLDTAINRASKGSQTELATMLASGGPYTLFAPVNNAFRAVGYSSISAIQSANADSLAKLLTYHMLPGRLFTTDLSFGGLGTTLNGETIAVFSAGSFGVTVKGNNDSTVSNLTSSNIMARNGVMHVIDRVLLP